MFFWFCLDVQREEWHFIYLGKGKTDYTGNEFVTLTAYYKNWTMFADISPHQNKKAISQFYHKKYFWLKMNVRYPMGVLQSFSIKNVFYDKMDLRLFYFDVTI